ncbi:M60 family metallopeptidase [Streptomyces coryli]|nr:M60 family metallopeptidase [Streptomyces coryli]
MRVLFGDDFYHRLHAAARPATDKTAGNDAARRHFFMVEASKAAQHDLTDYFTAWGLRPTADTRRAIASLDQPGASPACRTFQSGQVTGPWQASAKGRSGAMPCCYCLMQIT